MKAIFLTQDQIIAEEGSPRIPFFSLVGASAPATDLALLTASDDGFLMEPGGGINYYLADGGCIDRFGRPNPCSVCAVRPAIFLDPGEESLLQHRREEGEVATVEYGFFLIPVDKVIISFFKSINKTYLMRAHGSAHCNSASFFNKT